MGIQQSRPDSPSGEGNPTHPITDTEVALATMTGATRAPATSVGDAPPHPSAGRWANNSDHIEQPRSPDMRYYPGSSSPQDGYSFRGAARRSHELDDYHRPRNREYDDYRRRSDYDADEYYRPANMRHSFRRERRDPSSEPAMYHADERTFARQSDPFAPRRRLSPSRRLSPPQQPSSPRALALARRGPSTSRKQHSSPPGSHGPKNVKPTKPASHFPNATWTNPSLSQSSKKSATEVRNANLPQPAKKIVFEVKNPNFPQPPKRNTTEVNGVKEVPLGPKRASLDDGDSVMPEAPHPDTIKRAPLIFISFDCLPSSVSTVVHLRNFVKGFGPSEVFMDKENMGYLIVFPDTRVGEFNCTRCHSKKNGSVMFKEYHLRTEMFNTTDAPLWRDRDRVACLPDIQKEGMQQADASATRSESGDIADTSINDKDTSDVCALRTGIVQTQPISDLPDDENAALPDSSQPATEKSKHKQFHIDDTEPRTERESSAFAMPQPTSKAVKRSPDYIGAPKLPPEARTTPDKVFPAVSGPTVMGSDDLLERSQLQSTLGTDRDDAVSSISGLTDVSASRKACHICKIRAEPEALVSCSTCPRRYHRHCHEDPAVPSNTFDWQCRRCVQKGILQKSSRKDTADEATSGYGTPTLGAHSDIPPRLEINHMLEHGTLREDQLASSNVEKKGARDNSDTQGIFSDDSEARDLVEKSFVNANAPPAQVSLAGSRPGLKVIRRKPSNSNAANTQPGVASKFDMIAFKYQDNRKAGDDEMLEREPRTLKHNHAGSGPDGAWQANLEIPESPLETRQELPVSKISSRPDGPDSNDAGSHTSTRSLDEVEDRGGNASPPPPVLQVKAKRTKKGPVFCIICKTRRVEVPAGSREICTNCKVAERIQEKLMQQKTLAERAAPKSGMTIDPASTIESATFEPPGKQITSEPQPYFVSQDATDTIVEMAADQRSESSSLSDVDDAQVEALAPSDDRGSEKTSKRRGDLAQDDESTSDDAQPKKRKFTKRIYQHRPASHDNDLGDWQKRPKGTYMRLVSLALCDTPDMRLQATSVARWIEANVPGYDVKDQWANNVKATMIMNANGTNGPVMLNRVKWTPGDGGVDESDWYKLAPKLFEIREHWDHVSKCPVQPGQETWSAQPRTQAPSFASPQKSRGQESSTIGPSPQKSSSRKVKKKRPREIPIDELLSAEMLVDPLGSNSAAREHDEGNDGDESPKKRRKRAPLPAKAPLPLPQQHSINPVLESQLPADESPYVPRPSPPLLPQRSVIPIPESDIIPDESVPATAHAVRREDADVAGRPVEHVNRVEEIEYTPAEKKARYENDVELLKIFDEMRKEPSTKPFYEEWPQYCQRNKFDHEAKMAEIKARPSRKSMFGKPALYSVIGHTDADIVAMTKTPMPRMPHGQSHVTQLPDGTLLEEFENPHDFLGIPDNLFPVIHDKELAFRVKDGNRPTRQVYKP